MHIGDVGLVTLDPITAYMRHGKNFDSHRATDHRPADRGPGGSMGRRGTDFGGGGARRNEAGEGADAMGGVWTECARSRVHS